jgi:hypothetical protein
MISTVSADDFSHRNAGPVPRPVAPAATDPLAESAEIIVSFGSTEITRAFALAAYNTVETKHSENRAAIVDPRKSLI